MFELAPGGGSGNLESRPCRAARGSLLRAADTRGKQELAKEEKLSVMGVVHGKMWTSMPVSPSLRTSYRSLDDMLLLLCYRYTVLLGLFSNAYTPEVHLVSKRYIPLNLLIEAQQRRNLFKC